MSTLARKIHYEFSPGIVWCQANTYGRRVQMSTDPAAVTCKSCRHWLDEEEERRARCAVRGASEGQEDRQSPPSPRTAHCAPRTGAQRPMTTPLALHEQQRHEAARLYVEGRSVREVADRLGVIPKTVRKWLNQEGIGCEKGLAFRTPEPVRREIDAMTRAGCTQREIAARLGVCVMTVRRLQPRLKTLGAP